MPTFVVGDVHGYPETLARLLREAGLVDAGLRWSGHDARLWLVGDLVDRGPDGIGAIDLVMRLEREAPVRCLLGNHDAALLAAAAARESGADSRYWATWMEGRPPDGVARFRPEHAAWIKGLPAVARDGDWLLLHADTDRYLRLGRSVSEICATVSATLTTGDQASLRALVDILSHRHSLHDPTAVDRLLETLGGTRIVHGHTPIAFVTEADPELVVEPLVYGGGRVLNVDHCLFAGGPGFITELPVASRDEVGTKPSDAAL